MENKDDLEILLEKERMYNSDDFSELLLKHIIRDEAVFAAAKLADVRPEDFINSEIAGIRTYAYIAKLVFEIGTSPIARDLLELKIDNKNEKKSGADAETIEEYLNYVYKGGLNSEYIISCIAEFCEYRRYHKVMAKKLTDPRVLRAELSKVHEDVQMRRAKVDTKTLSPFEECVAKEVREGINIGIRQIDQTMGGLGKGELGLIIGHSASGKTAFASFMARMAAIDTHKVLYISAEEPADNIVCRWYAQQFGIEYNPLYRGQAELQKRSAFSDMTADERTKLSRLRIVDVRELVPLTKSAVIAILEQKAKEGFIPDVVFIDQMDYMKPERNMGKDPQKWACYEQVAFECDMLSQYKIQGEHEFALWIIHQGTGNRKWTFDYSDIAGFKGIVKPFDTAIGIGREPKVEGEPEKEIDHINVFSLKVRHCEPFQVPLLAEFKYMKFSPAAKGFKPKFLLDREAKAKRMTRTPGKPRKNEIPEQVPPTKMEA